MFSIFNFDEITRNDCETENYEKRYSMIFGVHGKNIPLGYMPT